MISVMQYGSSFDYEVMSMIKAFYPNEKIVYNQNAEEAMLKLNITYLEVGITILLENQECVIYKEMKQSNSKNKKTYKNDLKQMIYGAFFAYTNIQLQWGTLTGIRPTKIPMSMLEANIEEKLIRQCLKTNYLVNENKIQLCMDIVKNEYNILKQVDYEDGCSIYIGIPFCPTTCLYCSFTSFPLKKWQVYIDDYLQALYKEIDYVAAKCKKKIITLYIGGGTPTTLNENQLNELLYKIAQSFQLMDLKEYTIEAGRPDTITYEKLQIMKRYHVTRISINPQTMNEDTLKIIGRKHTIEDVKRSFNIARELGFHNINLDLIIGLPNEDITKLENTLRQVQLLRPDSLTIHSLAIKRASILKNQIEKYKIISEKEINNMYNLTRDYAEYMNMQPYYLYRQKNIMGNLENIGYMAEHGTGLYNILIMEEKHTIIALGAGASSKFVFRQENRIERVENVKDIVNYIQRIDEMIERKKEFM